MITTLTLIDGPTALIEYKGLRILTDPTFDPAGTQYRTPVYTLQKTHGPAVDLLGIGPIDVALVSHDHHSDNLDLAGRELLGKMPLVLTTVDGAGRLGGNARGLEPWQTYEIAGRDGRLVRITATPARHGPAGGDRGPVIGFVLSADDGSAPVVYLSGDTVWYDQIEEVGRRFTPDVAVLFMGAATVREVSSQHLTFTADEGVEAARTAFPAALIVPLHFDGWAHFAESGEQIAQAFAAAQLTHRLRLPKPAESISLERGELRTKPSNSQASLNK